MDKNIKKVAFVYLSQGLGSYYIADDHSESVQKRPQLGLQYLCAVLNKKGVETGLFDQTVTHFDFEWLIKELENCDIVGFYCSDTQEEYVKEWSVKIKEKLSIPILVGGPSTLGNCQFLDFKCDIVVYGESERTIQSIVDYYNGEKELDSINGISYKNKNGEIITTKPLELIHNLDELPFPDRSKIPIESYYDYFIFDMVKPYITMIASRGCFYRCTFCTSYKFWGNKYRFRSVDNVLAEIDEVVQKYGVRYIAFQDDVFGKDNNWIEEFSTKLIQRDYKVRWMCILHPFSLNKDTERILKLMKKAGCSTLSFGLQSSDAEVLINIKRSPKQPEYLKNKLRIANKLGYVTAVTYIFGLPGDTKETILETLNYTLNSGSTLVNYYFLTRLRGSDLTIEHGDKPVCELSDEEINKLVSFASRKFYTNPGNLFRIAKHILKNPRWIITIGLKLPSVLARIGLTFKGNKKEKPLSPGKKRRAADLVLKE